MTSAEAQVGNLVAFILKGKGVVGSVVDQSESKAVVVVHMVVPKDCLLFCLRANRDNRPQ